MTDFSFREQKKRAKEPLDAKTYRRFCEWVSNGELSCVLSVVIVVIVDITGPSVGAGTIFVYNSVAVFLVSNKVPFGGDKEA